MCLIAKPTKKRRRTLEHTEHKPHEKKNIDVTAVYIIDNYGNTRIQCSISSLWNSGAELQLGKLLKFKFLPLKALQDKMFSQLSSHSVYC